MKARLILLFFCSISLIEIAAQDTITNDLGGNNTINFEYLGLSLPIMIAPFWGGGESTEYSYGITFRRRFHAYFFRLGLGFKERESKLFTETKKTINLRPKIGIERFKDFNNHRLSFGLDIFGIYSEISRKTVNTPMLNASENRYGVGLGIIGGYSYYFNSNFAVLFETNFEYRSSSVSENQFNNKQEYEKIMHNEVLLSLFQYNTIAFCVSF